MTKKRWFDVLKIVISVGLIYLIVRNIDLRALLATLAGTNFGWLAAALALMIAGIFIRAWRWQILLDVLGVNVSINELAQIYFIGFLFNNLLPSGLGGDAIRIVELNRHSKHVGNAVTSVLVDRLLGLFGALTLALIALVFRWDAIPAQVALFSVVIMVVLLAGGFFLINRPLYEALRRISLFKTVTDVKFINSLFRSFQDYSLPALGKSYAVGLAFNVLLIGMNFAIGSALGAKISLVHYLVFVPITSLVLVLPISFAGLGVRESAYVYLFGQVGVAQEVALAMSLLVYFLGNVIPGLIGGVLYLWRGARGR